VRHTGTVTLTVHRAADRFSTEIDWLASHHSFSFGPHYNPGNTHHGLLLVNNDDVVAQGAGFETHPHRDMEIVTWVLDGSLVHQDSEGHNGLITPGLAQRMSAGSGIRHSEKNGGDGEVRFVQMWVVPDTSAIAPGYQQQEVDVRPGELIPVAGGRGDAAIRISQKDATLYVARLKPGQSVSLPDAPWVHLFVAQGDVTLEGAGDLVVGDAVRLTSDGGHALTARSEAEVLVWEMHSELG
jgi:redox-sensitive bicupin YhaK (pirin superfamily)